MLRIIGARNITNSLQIPNGHQYLICQLSLSNGFKNAETKGPSPDSAQTGRRNRHTQQSRTHFGVLRNPAFIGISFRLCSIELTISLEAKTAPESRYRHGSQESYKEKRKSIQSSYLPMSAILWGAQFLRIFDQPGRYRKVGKQPSTSIHLYRTGLRWGASSSRYAMYLVKTLPNRTKVKKTAAMLQHLKQNSRLRKTFAFFTGPFWMPVVTTIVGTCRKRIHCFALAVFNKTLPEKRLKPGTIPINKRAGRVERERQRLFCSWRLPVLRACTVYNHRRKLGNFGNRIHAGTQRQRRLERVSHLYFLRTGDRCASVAQTLPTSACPLHLLRLKSRAHIVHHRADLSSKSSIPVGKYEAFVPSSW